MSNNQTVSCFFCVDVEKKILIDVPDYNLRIFIFIFFVG